MNFVEKLTFGLTRSNTLVAFAVGLLIAWLIFRSINPRGRSPLKRISRTLMANGVPPAMIRIMLAQAVHETGNFQSPVFRFNNNAFGMKRPRIRKTLDLNGSSNDLLAIPEFAVFKNVEDSARDMLLYFDHFGVSMNFTDPFDYVQTLKSKGYFEDSLQNYFTGVRRAFDMLEPIS